MDSTAKRTTIYFDPALCESLRKKAEATSCSLSELVNEAVRRYLVEVQDNQDFNSSLKRGLEDAKAKRGHFVELVPHV